MKYEVSGVGEYNIDSIVFDLNGTIAFNGKLIKGVKKRFKRLKKLGFHLVIVSSDQHGNGKSIAKSLDVDFYTAANTDDKEKVLKKLSNPNIAAVGNGRVDMGLFRYSMLSIAIIESEGMHSEVMTTADLIFTSINNVLDFFINKNIFEATLK
ncbi:MAG: hypothetical protein PF487_14415 [Bacteroidales bacterium]|jgi:P-type E1-E2 ATPase|nr:hypothetical protein [Bacteroidales bacterium]